ncbi:MAG: hypothetical protein AB1499_01925 [Nitrospirota bacterium]
MKCKLIIGMLILIVTMFVACSSEKERLIEGKWTLTHTAIGGSPSSFWFKSNGTVIAPWEPHNYAMQSEGTYDLTDDNHIKIMMTKGYYKGGMYVYEIVKIDDKELLLGGTYEVLHLIKSDEKE